MIVTEIETDDFGLESTGSDFAKIFTTYTNMYGENIYNDNQIMFRVIHFSSLNGCRKPKEFLMTFVRDTSDIIKFRDLNPEEKNITVVYTVDANGVVDVYAKGSITGAKIKVQVMYCSCLGMHKFYNSAQFSNTPSNTVTPQNYDDLYGGKTELTLQNSWVKDTYYPSYCYKKGSLVQVNTLIYSGTYTADTTIANLPYVPEYEIYIPCSYYDASDNCFAGLLRLTTAGNLKVVNLGYNQRVSCCFAYFTAQ